jgi:ring-1,2-phenylacetyl-CoA epoxidase subunit PaaB
MAAKSPLDQWETYEVFAQYKRGEHHQHVGIVHASSPDVALLFAKEQYSRRDPVVNLWVVRTADITASEYEDADMFLPATDKTYREASGYKNREKIDEFRRRAGIIAPVAEDANAAAFEDGNTRSNASAKPPAGSKPTVIVGGKKKPTIIVGKK